MSVCIYVELAHVRLAVGKLDFFSVLQISVKRKESKMATTVNKLLLFLLLQQYLLLYNFVEPQQVFQQDPVPDPFELGDRYPNRDEFEECRPIKLQLERTSSRFSATITQNTNPELNFANADASLMTSRLKSRLDILADLYTDQFGGKLNVLLTYAEAGNPLVTTNDSLHYEGM